jgi:hypothetical protein
MSPFAELALRVGLDLSANALVLLPDGIDRRKTEDPIPLGTNSRAINGPPAWARRKTL